MERSEKMLTKNWVVCLIAMVCCFLWGSAFPCIKIGYQMFSIPSSDTASQILFAGIRFTLAGILTILIGSLVIIYPVKRSGKPFHLVGRKILVPAKTSWKMVFQLSLAQTVIQYLLFYIGLANTTGVKSSIIEGSNVFFALLVSSLIFHYEKMGARKIAGCILGFAGVVLINLNGSGLDMGMKLNGEGFIMLSTLSTAFSSALLKKFSQKENPITLSGYQFVTGGLLMAAAGAFMGGHLEGFTLSSTGLLIYLAIVSAVAYSLWGILLKYNPVGKVSVYGFMNPMFGVILSALLLGEQNQAFTMKGLVSLIFVCLGIFIVNKE